jgi:predicted nucleic acid-binding Zn ribbon protein
MQLSDAIVQYLRESGLEQSVLEVQVEEAWPKVMGDVVNRLTRSVEVREGVLIVHVNSAALKTQLFENRFELVSKLNEAVGAKVIRDCRILG